MATIPLAIVTSTRRRVEADLPGFMRGASAADPRADAQTAHVPAAEFRVAHTRHYMPWEKKRFDDRTLVFDVFVVVGRSDPVFVGWPDGDVVR